MLLLLKRNPRTDWEMPRKDDDDHVLDSSRRRVRMAPSSESSAAGCARAMTTTTAAGIACEEADNRIEDGDDAIHHGHDDVADAVDNRHDGSADCANAVLDLVKLVCCYCRPRGTRRGTYAGHDSAHFDGWLLVLGVSGCGVVE
jgi:hypothetical protein